MYVIKKGSIELFKQLPNSKISIKLLSKGDIIG